MERPRQDRPDTDPRQGEDLTIAIPTHASNGRDSPLDRSAAGRPSRLIQLMALGFLVVAAIALVVLNAIEKEAVDAYPLVIFAWLLGSGLALRKVRSTSSFVVVALMLVVMDAVADIVALGAWLHGPWWILNQIGLTIVGHPVIAAWRWDLGASERLGVYGLLFWGVAIPLRTLALLVSVDAGRAAGSTRRDVRTVALLAVGTALLYLGRVPTVVSFLLLGLPPVLRNAPLDFAALPTIPGYAWTALGLDEMAGIALILAIILFDVAIERERLAQTCSSPIR